MQTLEDLSPSKFRPLEQDTIREAADALLFAPGQDPDAEAREALAELRRMLDEMVEADRLLLETAEQLASDVEGCGPEPVPVA